MPSGIRPAPYQLIPLTKMVQNGSAAILIADGVGVGKTISAAYIATYVKVVYEKPPLVVCPPALVPKWVDELRTKFDLKAFPVRSEEDLHTAKQESLHLRKGDTPVYVMTNSILPNIDPKEYPIISAVIFDEIHTYRNSSTKSFLGALRLSKLAAFHVGLSATPINNSLDDLVSEFNILFPESHWDALQASVEEIWSRDRSKLSLPFVTRFTKDKLRIHFARRRIENRPTQYAPGYLSLVKETMAKLRRQTGKSSTYETITYYRLASSSPYAFKRALHIEDVDTYDPKLKALNEILSSHDFSHWLVFCEFEDTVQYLEKSLAAWNCFVLTGSTPMFDRPSIIEMFRKTPDSILIMTSVGSEGLDLQFCEAIVNYDLHWNPMRLEQRVGRIDRIGQTKDEVVVYNIIVEGSIDEHVIRVVARKLELLVKSVFAPGALLADSLTKRASQPIFDEPSLTHEIEESGRLITALNFTDQIQSEDYAIIDDIASEYCLPHKLNQAASISPNKTVWIGRSKRSANWIESVKAEGDSFRNLVKYYS